MTLPANVARVPTSASHPNKWDYLGELQKLTGLLFFASRLRSERELRRSGLVVRDWYLETYSDVERAGMDPVAHYARHGFAELRDPSPFFETGHYVRKYRDVAESGVNPLLHYIRQGAVERRITTAWAESAADRSERPLDIAYGAELAGLPWPKASTNERKRHVAQKGGSDPVIVVCNGMPRSGSTWSFNVAVELFRRVASAAAVHSGYDENVARFLCTVPRSAEHIVLKCHSLDPLGRTLARRRNVLVVYTLRDVADAVASSMTMWGREFEEAVRPIEESLELYALHRRSGRVLILDYDAIVRSPLQSIRRVAEYVGVEADDGLVRQVAEATSLERMRQTADHLKQAHFQQRLVRVNDLEHDRKTLLHPGHIQDGTSGYGRRLLSTEQLAHVDALARTYDLA